MVLEQKIAILRQELRQFCRLKNKTKCVGTGLAVRSSCYLAHRASFGVPEQPPREALDLKGTEVGHIATSLVGVGRISTTQPPPLPLGLTRHSSAQQAEGGCAAFYDP